MCFEINSLQAGNIFKAPLWIYIPSRSGLYQIIAYLSSHLQRWIHCYLLFIGLWKASVQFSVISSQNPESMRVEKCNFGSTSSFCIIKVCLNFSFKIWGLEIFAPGGRALNRKFNSMLEEPWESSVVWPHWTLSGQMSVYTASLEMTQQCGS